MRKSSLVHTFVICAFKDSPYLSNCIESLVSQKSVREGFSEVLLYTSTPSAYIESLCDKFLIKMNVGESKGIGADWNSALSIVKTKYATLAHQDDLYLPNYGSKVLASFDLNCQANIVFSDYYEIDAEGAERKRNINLNIKTLALKLLSISDIKIYQRRVYAFGNFISCPAVSYDIERLKEFRFDESLKMAVDWDAWERIMKYPGNIKYISERLVAHRIHLDSETTANNNEKREKEEYQLFRRYWGKNMTKLLMKFYVKNQKGNQQLKE
ncbi:glycosyltransferase family 2 protein [Lactovum miscens]|uniref:Glycosyltransferase 2-like domain-containing protein n=1 Tax=Lactovum miscens TaxID=190387 RepID=A0A841C8Y1_9LACT|nr:glycosyltransferase family 2 protein [Lactovum miscens]MBB5887680.1 hypothetical protein [Lactovum miscens]